MMSMSNKIYQKYHEKPSPTISKHIEKLVIEAGKEEPKMAIECGEETPLISVIVDGVQSKHSYSTNYKTLSGVVCIIGVKSKQILYMGVKNRYWLHIGKTNQLQWNQQLFLYTFKSL